MLFISPHESKQTVILPILQTEKGQGNYPRLSNRTATTRTQGLLTLMPVLFLHSTLIPEVLRIHSSNWFQLQMTMPSRCLAMQLRNTQTVATCKIYSWSTQHEHLQRKNGPQDHSFLFIQFLLNLLFFQLLEQMGHWNYRQQRALREAP